MEKHKLILKKIYTFIRFLPAIATVLKKAWDELDEIFGEKGQEKINEEVENIKKWEKAINDSKS